MKKLKIPEFQLKAKNSDFQVREIFYLPKELGPEKSTHSYLNVEKSGLTTFQLQDKLAKILNIPRNHISASGLKDEQAITRQVVSVKKIVTASQFNNINRKLLKEHSGMIKIIRIEGYGRNPVVPKVLHGNEFKITIRNLDPDVAVKLKNKLNITRYHNFINYYDEQRFGTPESCHNTHLVGKFLLAKHWIKALNEYMKSGNNREELTKVQQVYMDTSSPKEALLKIDENKRNFFISSYNSYLWNQKLSKSLSRSGNGAIVEFPFIGKLTIPENRDLPIKAFLSLKTYELNWNKEEKIEVVKNRPVNIVTATFLVREQADELFKAKRALTLSFILPTGSYATMFIKQLLLN